MNKIMVAIITALSIGMYSPSPAAIVSETKFIFNRGYLLYTVCKTLVFEKDYVISLLNTNDEYVRGRISGLKQYVARHYSRDACFDSFSGEERSARSAENPYSVYQRSLSPPGIDRFESLLHEDTVMAANPSTCILEKLLRDPEVRTYLEDIKKYVDEELAPRYRQGITDALADLRLGRKDRYGLKAVSVHYSAASFGETGGLYTGKNRRIIIPDITDYTIFMNEVFHVVSFDLIRYDNKYYDSLAAKNVWLNFNRPVNVVLFPFTPFELIDNYLAFRFTWKKSDTVSSSPPYLQLFYNSYVPHLSKMYLGTLFDRFDKAFQSSGSYHDFVERALSAFNEYQADQGKRIIYSTKFRISDFFTDTGDINFVDGNIQRPVPVNLENADRLLPPEAITSPRLNLSGLYRKFDYKNPAGEPFSFKGGRFIIVFNRERFLDFIDSTFIFVSAPERVNPHAKNLQNLSRLYYLIKDDKKIRNAMLYYFGVLVLIADDERNLRRILHADPGDDGIFVMK